MSRVVTSLYKFMHLSPQRIEKKAEAAVPGEIYVRDSDFLTEHTFREVLSFERKRSERTRKSIQLMLLDVNSIVDTCSRYSVIRNAARALTDIVLDAHVKGWYRYDTILGVLFPEIKDAEKEGFREALLTRIRSSFSAEENSRVRVLFRSFPAPDGAQRNGDGDGDPSVFYPDTLRTEKTKKVSLFFKRAMDVAGGAAGIIIFSPLFIVIPLLIKWTSTGPVLFRQDRVGRHGEKFVFLKFRTMYENNDPTIHQEYIKKLITEQKSYDGAGKGVYKIKNDPRVTAIGTFLRKTSFDELPQFFNVLKGEMSLVGPRPPIPYELEDYDLWHRRRVMEVKPGITGLWQVEGRSSTTFDEMVRLDLKYSKEWSVWLDIKILLKTPWVVIAGKGAY